MLMQHSNYINLKAYLKLGTLSLFLTYFWSISSVFAANGGPSFTITTGGTLSEMLVRLGADIPTIMRLVTAVAYVLGFVFMIKGIIALKEYGEMRSMMTQGHSLKGPLLYLGIGAALLYLPSSINIGMTTFWAEPNPYGYVTNRVDTWSQLLNAAFMIMQLIGVISFIRGLIVLSHLGAQAQPGTLGKALAHIIAGICLINMYQFLQVVGNTLGLWQMS